MIKHGERYLQPESRPGNWLLSHKISKVRPYLEGVRPSQRTGPCRSGEKRQAEARWGAKKGGGMSYCSLPPPPLLPHDERRRLESLPPYGRLGWSRCLRLAITLPIKPN